YEEAIAMTAELNERQAELSHSHQSLEGLYRIAEYLNSALTESEVAQGALDRILEVHGILGGCINVNAFDGNGTRELLVARDYPSPGSNIGPLVMTDFAPPDLANRGASHFAGQSSLADRDPQEGDSGEHEIQVPLWSGPKLLGRMKLWCVKGALEREKSLKMFGTIGNRIAIAMERAHLYMNLDILVSARSRAMRTECDLLTTLLNTASALVVLLVPS